MHQHAVFTSLHRGKPLAASIASTRSDRSAWLGVYPLDLEMPTTRDFLRNHGVKIFPQMGRVYHIRCFEVKRQLIENDVSLGETELENKISVIVFGDDDLVKELEKRGVAIESLEPHFKSDYPI